MLMKSLVSTTVPIARNAIAKNAPRMTTMSLRLAHHEVPAELRPATMDELPIPCGSWKEHYDNQQRKYNVFLLSSVGFFLITFFAVSYSGVIDMNLKYPQPASRETMNRALSGGNK